ncbi:hypothetical protein CAEBREN_13152 [Caenorhabditis brenneri]|uniref:Serpentine receptor class gamma n=1 Tax=Caenorhabditis brenneri TaxID=135651 RepID=G0N8K2_CAEBE|nr:hypothetical protein CAEBREN_13152 [Caenorhabditis brenneri]
MSLGPLLAFCIALLYGIPSLFLYFTSIYIIIKYQKVFDSSFFTMFIYDGIMNLFTYFVGFYMMRLSSITCYDCLLYPIYRNAAAYFPMNFLTAMSYHMAYVQYTTTALISLNRLTVLWRYTFFEPFWKQYTWLFMGFVFMAPFADTHRCFYYKTDIVFDEDTNSYGLLSEMPITLNFQYLIPAMVIISVTSIVLNVTCFLKVKKINTQKRNKAEFNFVIIMCITCVVQALGCGLSVARIYMAEKKIAILLAAILPFVSDGLTLVQPWLLVSFSNAMRGKIKQMIGIHEGTLPQGSLMVRSLTN